MGAAGPRWSNALIVAWTAAVVLFLYIPSISGLLASLGASRYFNFPIAKWGLDWWGKTFAESEIRTLWCFSMGSSTPRSM